MRDVFITGIHIDKVRHLENIDIALSETERKHLILTGKNGSGKTSLLKAMRASVHDSQRKFAENSREAQLPMELYEFMDSPAYKIDISFSEGAPNLFEVVFAYISAERNKPPRPGEITKIDLQGKTIINKNAGQSFLGYALNLYVQYLSAKDLGESAAEIENYRKWFDDLKEALRDIYGNRKLELKPDLKNLDFRIELPGKEPFGFNEMADGYSAFFNIFMELLLRSENSGGLINYKQPAVVLIDELEAHLHVELQKRALPFLTRMFPNAQFIVATHSPFVLTSVDNAVIFDLEQAFELQAGGRDVSGARLDGADVPLTTYAYEDIVEGYFDVSGYSEIFLREFARYKELCDRVDLTADEKKEKATLKFKMDCVPPSAKLLRCEIDAFENGGACK